MAAQMTQSLLEILGPAGQQAHEKTKKNETTFGMANLPVGIAEGVAQLKTVSWKKYAADDRDLDKRGKPCVIFRGIAITPKSFNGVSVAGKGVMLTIPLYAQSARVGGRKNPVSFEENYADLLNTFRQFGVPTDNMQFTQLEAVMKHLTDSKPHYLYSTRGYTPPPSTLQPKPTEMVFVEFLGKCDPKVVEQHGMQDHSGDPDMPLEGGQAAEPPPGSAQPDADGALEELALRADGDPANGVAGDQQAIIRMGELAIAAGLTQRYIENEAQNWVEIAAAISSGGQQPSADTTTAAAVASPEPQFTTGKMVGWKALDKFGKLVKDKFGKEKKPLQCEVVLVNDGAQTVTLKNLANPKELFKEIKFADLLPAE